MKKEAVFSVVLLLTSMRAFGTIGPDPRGIFDFSGPIGGAWDNFSSPGIGKISNDIRVNFLWSSGLFGPAPLVATIAESVSTNAAFGGSIPSGMGSAWNAILNDPNYHLAAAFPTGLPISPNGGWSLYPVFIDGTSFYTEYSCYVIGWDASFSTPQDAAANGASVGWSQLFRYGTGYADGRYTYGIQSMTDRVIPFGVVPIPESDMLHIVGFGSALWLCRRGGSAGKRCL